MPVKILQCIIGIMIKAQTLKGFRDFLPQDAAKRLWFKNKLIAVFESWGYLPLETPTLEPVELFAGQVGEGEKLFYRFKDQGGREVALRYDQTVPACRVVGQYTGQLVFPFKRYQIQPAFRSEKPQKGRYREFLQCDADIFGVKSVYADAEVCGLALDIYRQLGFKEVRLSLNDRELMKELPYEAIVVIDKLKKIGQEKVLAEMTEKGISSAKAEEYLKLVQNLKPNKTVKIILNCLEKMGFPKNWFNFEPTLARSFSYSTGPIFEIEIPGYQAGSVLGGERFDNIVKNISGLDIPGTGFAVGFDRTLEAVEQFGLLPDFQPIPQVLVTIFSADLFEDSLKISSSLRSEGIKTELYPNPENKLDKQLKYADQKGIPFAVIAGPDEINKFTVTVKNLVLTKQETLPREKLADYFKNQK
ncbi:MAG: Histidine--tRNA ligase [Microgenomates group bacterium ADurb.Bin219]|nr:MAG: Histidine--tRNA ligase [Microgenomates group bacterium ADurb.Bin219]